MCLNECNIFLPRKSHQRWKTRKPYLFRQCSNEKSLINWIALIINLIVRRVYNIYRFASLVVSLKRNTKSFLRSNHSYAPKKRKKEEKQQRRKTRANQQSIKIQAIFAVVEIIDHLNFWISAWCSLDEHTHNSNECVEQFARIHFHLYLSCSSMLFYVSITLSSGRC